VVVGYGCKVGSKLRKSPDHRPGLFRGKPVHLSATQEEVDAPATVSSRWLLLFGYFWAALAMKPYHIIMLPSELNQVNQLSSQVCPQHLALG
jgi:hypothetical protein